MLPASAYYHAPPDISELNISELREELGLYCIDTSGFIEKREFTSALQEARETLPRPVTNCRKRGPILDESTKDERKCSSSSSSTAQPTPASSSYQYPPHHQCHPQYHQYPTYSPCPPTSQYHPHTNEYYHPPTNQYHHYPRPPPPPPPMNQYHHGYPTPPMGQQQQGHQAANPVDDLRNALNLELEQALIGQMNALLGGRLQGHLGHQQFQQQHQQAPHHQMMAGGDNSNVIDPIVAVAADVALGDAAVATSCCVLS